MIKQGEQLYSSGEFAKMNSISKKALRIYEELGIINPVFVNEKTGYRFYSLSQCSALDAIQQIQDLGASLAEIKTLLDSENLESLKSLVEERLESLDAEMLHLRMAQYNANKILHGFNQVVQQPILDTPIFERRPVHYALEFPILNERARNLLGLPCADYIREWELNLRLTKQYMLDKGLPSALFRNVGCKICRENLLAGKMELSGSFVFIDDEYLASRFNAERLSDGTCLVMYKNSYETAQGGNSEVEGLQTLLDFAKSVHLEIAGDYYGEIIADTPAFLYQSREMSYKLQFRVTTSSAV